MNGVGSYWEELSQTTGAAWNRFWFSTAPTRGWGELRIMTGLLALWLLLSHTWDLGTWFGPAGLLPIELVRQTTTSVDGGWNGRLSYLMWTDDPSVLYVIHLAGLAVVALFTLGVACRVTGIATLAIVLSYIHRAPMIAGLFEPVLSFTLFYLCFAPCQALSVDAWWRQRRGGGREYPTESVTSNVVWRMLQVHVAAFYWMLGTTKLAGDVWWNGEAMWWVIAHTESRLLDLSWLHSHPYVLNLWTHGVVLFELCFAVLIWSRLARPVLLVLAVLHWLALGLVTGLLSYAVMMLVVSSVFWSRGKSH